MATSFNEEEMFQRLIESLPDEYAVIRQSMTGLRQLPIMDRVRILRDEEDKMTENAALAARFNQRDRRFNEHGRKFNERGHHSCRRSDSESSADRRRSKRATRHDPQPDAIFAKEGTQLKTVSIWKVPRNTAKQSSRSRTRVSPRSHVKGKEDSQAKKHKSRKVRAYDAESEEGDSYHESSEEESEEEETAAVSKDAASKIPSSSWVADSGASSHMTDQRNLFRSLTPIHRRVIKVGEGKLYATHVGEVVLKTENGHKVKLCGVYYVPYLSVNLLSGRKLCDAGLLGAFNRTTLRMVTKTGKTMLKATEAGGVYVVDWVARGINEMVALNAIERLVHAKPTAALSAMQVDTSSEQPERKHGQAYQLWHRRFAHLGHGILR